MAVTLGKLRQSLKKITLEQAQDLTADIITSDTKLISRKRDEFKAGVNPEGDIIGTYKSASYRAFKLQLNPFAQGNVDLILTGSLKQGLEAEYLGNGEYIIFSTDEKWEKLKAKYGSQISSINQEQWERLQKVEYAPKLNKALRRLSGL